MAANTTNGGRGGVPWRIVGWGAATFLLMVPLVASWPWTALDFVFAGVLFAAVGGTLELAARMTRNTAYRAGVGVALAAAFLLIWINAAVGIIGSEGNPANAMYIGVLGIAALGAVVARARPGGMARAMTAAAAAQLLVALIALLAGLGATEPPGPTGVLLLNGFFVALFLGSAALFRVAARDQAAAGARRRD